MPNEVEYAYDLEREVARIRTRFTTDGPDVGSYMVQLEAFQMDGWKPVRRCDDHHGRPHIDNLDRRGRVYHKEWLDVDRNTALTMAIQDFKANWRAYLAEFLEGESHE